MALSVPSKTPIARQASNVCSMAQQLATTHVSNSQRMKNPSEGIALMFLLNYFISLYTSVRYQLSDRYTYSVIINGWTKISIGSFVRSCAQIGRMLSMRTLLLGFATIIMMLTTLVHSSSTTGAVSSSSTGVGPTPIGHIELLNGIITSGYIDTWATQLYSFAVSDTSGGIPDVTIRVTPLSSIITDISVRNDGNIPTRSYYQWSLGMRGAYTMTIPRTNSYACNNCRYSILLYGWSATQLSIVASSSILSSSTSSSSSTGMIASSSSTGAVSPNLCGIDDISVSGLTLPPGYAITHTLTHISYTFASGPIYMTNCVMLV